MTPKLTDYEAAQLKNAINKLFDDGDFEGAMSMLRGADDVRNMKPSPMRDVFLDGLIAIANS